MNEIEDRFWSRVIKTATCWLWPVGPKSKNTYGRFAIGKKIAQAHRVAYELTHGPIPLGLHIDHLCRVKQCVNPAHLEVVTCRINILRGVSPTARNARKTHCPKGHTYNAANTYYHNGSRHCMKCSALRCVVKRAVKRAAARITGEEPGKGEG